MQGTPSRSERDIRSLDDGTPFLDLGCHKDLEIVWASARSDDSEAIEHFFCLRRLEEGVGGGVELRDDLRGRVRRREQRVPYARLEPRQPRLGGGRHLGQPW